MAASTPMNRTIAALRRRAVATNDDYLNVAADDMERMYVLFMRRGEQLIQIQAILGIKNVHMDNEVSEEDRKATRS
jgi:hypothetical protein